MKKNYGIVMKFYRVMRWFEVRGFHHIAKFVSTIIRILFCCAIPPTTILGPEVEIAHGLGIVLHLNTVIGARTKIYQHVTVGNGNGPKIGCDCILGTGCVILGNITIGDNVRIGANAVVLQDVPSNCTAVGVPARIIYRGAKK